MLLNGFFPHKLCVNKNRLSCVIKNRVKFTIYNKSGICYKLFMTNVFKNYLFLILDFLFGFFSYVSIKIESDLLFIF